MGRSPVVAGPACRQFPRGLRFWHARQFAELAAAWRKDTELTSSLTDMFAHPAYQRIIGMGAAALPMIFRELANEPDYWFGALPAITGCDPVPPAHRGDLQRMAADWLACGRTRGLAP
jgi:hypothetical protein